MMLIALKTLHIAALAVWAGGLIALPALLRRDAELPTRARAVRLHHFSRFAHDALISPAAVLTIASGTALIFYVEADDWLFLKLAAVAAMGGTHMLIARALDALETPGPGPAAWMRALLLLAACASVIAVLVMVLARPSIPEGWMPQWLIEGQEADLPFISDTDASSFLSSGTATPT